ncbi:2OG-Fe(II) oxygenase [Candidatus Woesearchaeota archaeon]|nr:2OG-Fe(II) oxygenase [Candidatus Woesearchaeota archaeon]
MHQLTPFPHCFIRNFLDKDTFHAVRNALYHEQFHIVSSDLFSFMQTHDLRTAQSAALQHFVQFISRDMHKVVASLFRVQTTGWVDAFGSLYRDTDYLLLHDDRLESRQVAFIYYLTTMQPKQGGQLMLYASDARGMPSRIARTYLPQENSLMLFAVSRRSWHAVSEVVNAKRYAIGGWFHGQH